jgi:hypothetical protein
LVRTLMHGSLAGGYHIVAWNGMSDNGQTAGSGRYVCRLASGGFSKGIRMTVAR